MKGGPEAIARAAEVVADCGGVEAGVNAREKDHEVFGREIWNELVARREDLAFARFPGSDQFPMHGAAFSSGRSHQIANELFGVFSSRRQDDPTEAAVGKRLSPYLRAPFVRPFEDALHPRVGIERLALLNAERREFSILNVISSVRRLSIDCIPSVSGGQFSATLAASLDQWPLCVNGGQQARGEESAGGWD